MNSSLVAVGVASFMVAWTQYDTRISPNFTLSDVLRSKLAERYRLEQSQRRISQASIKNARRLAYKVLEPTKKFLDAAAGRLRVTSWYRSKQVNDLAGGVGNSRHRTGQAADLVYFYMGARRNDLLARALSFTPFTRLILEKGTLANPLWIHVEYERNFQGKPVILYTSDGKTYQRISRTRFLQLYR